MKDRLFILNGEAFILSFHPRSLPAFDWLVSVGCLSRARAYFYNRFLLSDAWRVLKLSRVCRGG